MKKTENATGTWRTTYTMFEGNNPLMQELYTADGRIQASFNIIADGIGGVLLLRQPRLAARGAR